MNINYVWLLSQGEPPHQNASQQVREIYDWAVNYEHEAGENYCGGISLVFPPDDPTISAYGTPVEEAIVRARRYAQSLRHEADRIERTATEFGGRAFIAESVPMKAPLGPYNAGNVLAQLLAREDSSGIVVNGRYFPRTVPAIPKAR